eukprot:s121_g42.t1
MRAAHLLPVLAFIAQIPSSKSPNDFVEICAGDARASCALRQSGFAGKEYDVLYSKNHDLLRTIGFITMLMAVRNLRPGGLVLVGPPCSSWIFLSRSQTGRSWSNPEGNGRRAVELANIFIRRLLYILYFAHKRGCKFLIEQPVSSVLWYFRPMRQFLQFTGARRVSFPMGSYGSPTIKMTVTHKGAPLVKKTISKSGKQQVTGIRGALRESASYPAGFGFALAALIEPEGSPAQSLDLDIGAADPDEDDDQSIDDLIRVGGRKSATWRKLLMAE